MLFHEGSEDGGYFDEAPLSGPGPAVRLFWHPNEPSDAIATKHKVIWINEPRHFSRAALFAANYNGYDKHKLGGRVGGNAEGLAVAGGFVYWADLYGIGRVGLDGSRFDMHFARVGEDVGHDSAASIATDGRYLYVAECGRGIGRIALRKSRSRHDVTWLAREPRQHRPFFCPQEVAVGGHRVYYGSGNWIGRMSLDGRHRQDLWHRAPGSSQPTTILATRHYLYVDTCAGPNCADGAHIARMTTKGRRVRRTLYAHVDQGLTLAP